MRIGVIVASLGRPELIGELMHWLAGQTLKADGIIISVETGDDLPAAIDPHIQVVLGERGASKQRNRALDIAIKQFDIVVFIDDDFIPSRNFIEKIYGLFTQEEIVGATGLVLDDGVTKGGLSSETAIRTIDKYEKRQYRDEIFTRDVKYAYGCNMAFRSTAVAKIRFDENLPLHSWQEDVDFGSLVSSQGRMVYTNAFTGVHRGVISSRSSGRRIGYSQISNPVYLLRKGTMSPYHAITLMVKNLLANHLKVFRPERYIDRFGRVCGNWKAIWDLIRNKCDPSNIIGM